MEPKVCIKCGGPIPDTASTGRPRSYCSPVCKRASAHEIRRVNALLSKLEEQASSARRGIYAPDAKHVKSLADEIEFQESRLRALLEGSEE